MIKFTILCMKKILKYNRKKLGFTLIELLAVIVILSIILLIATSLILSRLYRPIPYVVLLHCLSYSSHMILPNSSKENCSTNSPF